MSSYAGIERRRSPRVSDGIKARIFDKDVDDTVAVLNISFHGALLNTPYLINIGKILNLAMRLPVEAGALDVTARVVRVVTVCSSLGFRSFNIGVEFLNLVHDQKEKLTETIHHLLGKSPQ